MKLLKLFEYLQNFGYTATTSVIRWFPSQSDSDYKNFKLLYATKSDPLPQRNFELTQHHISIVTHALRRELLGYDAEHIINDYHRPAATPELFEESMTRSDLPDHPVNKDVHYIRARQRAKDLLTPPVPFRPLHLTDLLQTRWNKSASAELPYVRDPVLRKQVHTAAELHLLPNAKMNFANLQNAIFEDVRNFAHQVKRRTVRLDPSNYQAILPDRLHAKSVVQTKDKAKLRIIFGRMKRDILISAMFWKPYFRWLLIDRFNDPSNPLLWGLETILGGWHKLTAFTFSTTFTTQPSSPLIGNPSINAPSFQSSKTALMIGTPSLPLRTATFQLLNTRTLLSQTLINSRLCLTSTSGAFSMCLSSTQVEKCSNDYIAGSPPAYMSPPF